MRFWRRKAALPHVAGKVIVVGASSPVGQLLSLLLKTSPHVQELYCANTALESRLSTNENLARPNCTMPSLHAVVRDLARIDTATTVRVVRDVARQSGDAPAVEDGCAVDWAQALRGAQLVLFCPGVNFDLDATADRQAALQDIAPALQPIVERIAYEMHNSQVLAMPSTPVLAVLSEPLNALVPLCAAWLGRGKDGPQSGGLVSVFDPRKLFGVTTVDVHHARRLVAEQLGMNPFDVTVPVVGGRGGRLACPVIAQTGLRLPLGAYEEMVAAIRGRGRPAVALPPMRRMKDGVTPQSAQALVRSAVADESFRQVCSEDAWVHQAVAYAGFDFATSLLKALRGDYGITECALVESSLGALQTPFFSSRVQLGREGVERILPLGELSSLERHLVGEAVPLLAEEVELGRAYYEAHR